MFGGDLDLNFIPRFVAYLDVLGFRAMVENVVMQGKLKTYFSTIETSIPHQTSDKSNIEIETIVFSDTIVLAAVAELNVENLCRFLLRVRNIQFDLTKVGIYLRGGITYGPLHLDIAKSYIVGSALNKAYDLEKLAKYPRVIINPAIVDQLRFTRSDFIQAVNTRPHRHESENDLVFDHYKRSGIISEFPFNAYFVNYLAPMRWSPDEHNKAIFDAVKSQCNEDQEHYLKYRWIIDYATRVTKGPLQLQFLSL